jgi:hypothetical protein
MAIKQEIESRCTYNLRAEAAPFGQDAVEYFLFGDVREGYCDLFASAMALMARSQGIPARMATGYFPSSGETDAQGMYVVRESDAHAWAELYFEGVGWVPFDATEGADSVPGGGRGDPTVSRALIHQPWFRWLLGTLVAMAALLGLGFVVAPGRRGTSTHSPEHRQLSRAYSRFVAFLERASRRPRRLSETPSEYLQVVAPHLLTSSVRAEALNRQFEAAFYSSRTATKELVAGLEAELRALAAAWRLERRGAKPG